MLLTTRVSFAVKGGYDGLFFSGPNAPVGLKGPMSDFDAQLELGFHFTDVIFARIGEHSSSRPSADPTGTSTMTEPTWSSVSRRCRP